MEWNFKKHFIASVVVVFVNVVVEHISKYMFIIDLMRESLFSPNSAASIAIIGGADGPTAIYRTGMYGLISVWGEHLILLLVLLFLYLPFRRLMMGSREA